MKLCEEHMASVHVRTHVHFGQSSNIVIKVFACLFIVIKISVRHIV